MTRSDRVPERRNGSHAWRFLYDPDRHFSYQVNQITGISAGHRRSCSCQPRGKILPIGIRGEQSIARECVEKVVPFVTVFGK